jgi:hypothetical protein
LFVLFFGRVTAFYLMVIFDFNFLGQGTPSPVNPLQGTPSPVNPLQGTPSPVNPLAYGMKVCVRAYGASACTSIFKHFCRRLSHTPKCCRLGVYGEFTPRAVGGGGGGLGGGAPKKIKIEPGN